MADDDFLLKGSMRRVQVVRQFVPDDDESAEKVPISGVENAKNADENVQPGVQQDRDRTGHVEEIGQAEDAETEAALVAIGDVDAEGEGGKFIIKIDEEAPNWIQEVRESGGGLTAGPANGVIAKPTGVSDERFATRPEEPEEEEEEPPKTLDEIRAEGRKILDGEDDEEFEAEVERTMGALKRLMANVERSLFGRKQ